MSATVSPMSQRATMNQKGSLNGANGAHLVELEGSPGSTFAVPTASTQGQPLPLVGVDPALTFAEKIDNPPPQVVFDDGAEVVREEIQPDVTREDLMPEGAIVALYGEKVPFWKKKSTIIVMGIFGVLGIIAVVMGVLAGTGTFHSNQIAVSPASSTLSGILSTISVSSAVVATPTTLLTTTSGAATSPSSTSAATETGPPPSSPSQCLDNSHFVRNVSQITGLIKAHDRGYDFAQADSLVQCCSICHMLTTTAYESCDFWSYDETSANVPCVIVRGYIGDNPDRNCKYGHTKVDDFSIRFGGNAVAGPGPCGPEEVGLPGAD